MFETVGNWLTVVPSDSFANMPNWVVVVCELLQLFGNIILLCLFISVLIDIVRSMMNSNKAWWYYFAVSCLCFIVVQLVSYYYS